MADRGLLTSKRRGVASVCLWLLACLSAALFAGRAQAENCDKAAFEALVAETGKALQGLNDEHKRAFQESLQKLKVSAGWSDADYASKAKAFLNDDETAALDTANNELRTKIQALGGGEAADDKRCAILAELKGLMEKLVANAKARWEHMIAKVKDASAGGLQAGAARP
jgi:hypothetical protein